MLDVKKPTVLMILGIRPDVIRASLLIKILKQDPRINFVFVWSGQHYSDNLKDVFFRELDVPRPDIELMVQGSTDGEIVSDLIKKVYVAVEQERPHAVIFLGDTNTVASCIAVAQHNVPIIHIEGCMRSYNWIMPEEKYRTMCDHLSDLIYAYFDEYKEQGIAEGLNPNNIVVTGNLIVDVLNEYYWSKKAEYQRYATVEFFESKGLLRKQYYVMTCHRRENISNLETLNNIFNLAKSLEKIVYFPAGYRTQKHIEEFKISVPSNVILVDPVGYKDIITLMVNSLGVLTDSGTIVEEACVLQVPSIQMRTSTERPQVYDVNSSVKFDPFDYSSEQLEKVRVNFFGLPTTWNHNLGDGKATFKIADDLVQRVLSNRLSGHTREASHLQTARAYSE